MNNVVILIIRTTNGILRYIHREKSKFIKNTNKAITIGKKIIILSPKRCSPQGI